MAQAQAIPPASAHRDDQQSTTGNQAAPPVEGTAHADADASREAACSCLNIRLRYQPLEQQDSDDAEVGDVQRVRLIQDGISVVSVSCHKRTHPSIQAC